MAEGSGPGPRATRPIEDATLTAPAAGLVDRAWKQPASLGLALGLILAIATLGLISVLLTQAPTGLPTGSPAFGAWLERVARPRYGASTDILATLQLFTATSSIWMRLLLSLLAANTLVCTLNRLPGLLRPLQQTSASTRGDTLAAGQTETVVWPRDERVDLVAEQVARSLRAAKYRVSTGIGSVALISADRNRFARLGTLATHSAIILFLAGAYATSAWGLQLPGFDVAEGSTRAVGLETALRLRLDDFGVAYHQDGTPSDYRSDVVLLDGDVELSRQTVRVNEPLLAAGLRFHQESFGPAAEISITDDAGTVAFASGVALGQAIGGRPAGLVDLDEDGAEVIVLGAAPGDPALQPGQVRVEVLANGQQRGGATLSIGQVARVAGLTIAYSRERSYSSFQIVRDPGAPIVWLASVLLIVGVAVTFGFPYGNARVRVRSLGDGRTALDIANRGRVPSNTELIALIEPGCRPVVE